jgi:hypothetical protein
MAEYFILIINQVSLLIFVCGTRVEKLSKFINFYRRRRKTRKKKKLPHGGDQQTPLSCHEEKPGPIEIRKRSEEVRDLHFSEARIINRRNK